MDDERGLTLSAGRFRFVGAGTERAPDALRELEPDSLAEELADRDLEDPDDRAVLVSVPGAPEESLPHAGFKKYPLDRNSANCFSLETT